MDIPSGFEAIGATLAILAVIALGGLAIRPRLLPWWANLLLGGVAGAGVTAFWGARVHTLDPGWWAVGVVVGAALGALPLLGQAWAGRNAEVRIGDYAVDGVLGSGASGTVYRARSADGAAVAIKVLAPEWMGDAEFRARFRAEAALMTQLNHPNCVRVIDVLDDDVVAAIVSELVDGASLRVVLESSGRLDAVQALDVMQGALAGLSYLHARGIVHRDVKPENILVDRHGVSKLVDFGLARRVGEWGTGGVESVGSPRYMSPEQVEGRAIDVRTDVYSCGVVLFELLTSRSPFTATDVAGVLRAHVQAPVPDPRSIRPDIPGPLAELCMAALAKDPADRPATAAEFLERLTSAAQSAYGASWLAGTATVGLAAVVGAVVGAGFGAAAAGGAAGAGGLAAAAAGLAPLASPSVGAASSVTQVVPGSAAPTGPGPAAPTGPVTGAPPGAPTGPAPGAPTGPATGVGAPTAATETPAPSAPPPHSTLVHVGRTHRPGVPRHLHRKSAAAAVVIIVLAMLGGGAGVGAAPVIPAGFRRPSGALAACVVGTWRSTRYAYEDVWDGTPVLVQQPLTGPIEEVAYEADGRMVSVAPAGELPSTGTLDGAPFLDQRFGTWTGIWTNEGDHGISQSVENASRWFDLLFTQATATSGRGTFLKIPTAHGRRAAVLSRSTVCTATSLRFTESFRYHGHTISDNSSYVRLPPGTRLPAAASVPPEQGLLGGLNLAAYCANALRLGGVRLTRGLAGPGAAYDNWACGGANASALDFDNACEWDWADASAVARPLSPDVAYGWLCYRSGAAAPASVTLKPSSGGAGTAVTITSPTACPTGSYSLSYGLSATGADRALLGGSNVPAPRGPVMMTATIDPFGTKHLPPGLLRIYLWCSSKVGPDFAYLPAAFHFTGS